MRGRRSIRLPYWDYSSDGAYFITMNTKNRIHHFSEIRNGIMGLNEHGGSVAKFWQEIPLYFQSAVLDEWVILPDHFHGIILIKNKKSAPIGVIHKLP